MRHGLITSATLLLLVSVPASADFIYTVSYDAQTIDGRTYPADSYSFQVSSILPGSLDFVSVPGGELNGFTFTSLASYDTGPDHAFEVFSNFSRPTGEVAGLYFLVLSHPSAVGTYDMTEAGRGIKGPAGDVAYTYGTGSLTISVAPVEIPEPASWELLISVTGAAFVLRVRHRLRHLLHNHRQLQIVPDDKPLEPSRAFTRESEAAAIYGSVTRLASPPMGLTHSTIPGFGFGPFQNLPSLKNSTACSTASSIDSASTFVA